MRALLLTLIFTLASLLVNAQQQQMQSSQPLSQKITIHGYILDKSNGKGVEQVNVMLQNRSQTGMYKFVLSKGDGTYSLEYSGSVDSLTVVVTGFNISATTKDVVRKSQRLDFRVQSQELKIREVVVKAQPVVRQSDTLKYNVASYTSANDSAIEDVLRKMPGIEVSKLGQIKYQGKAINKFYVEGLDLMGGRYGVVSKNVKAKDIARVEVYENHQPIKALKKVFTSDQAALNLILKEKARGIWTGTLQLGGGYKPYMWNGEAVTMYLARKFQTINTYKTNNMGDDISRELQSFYGGMEDASSILGVQKPSIPPLDKERYLNNDIHTISVNTISKIKEDVTFRANSSYAHDFQTSEGASRTIHFISGAEPILIEESTYAEQRSDNVNIDLNIRSNKNKTYLNNDLKFKGSWSDDYGRVVNGGDEITQHFNLPRLAFTNNFRVVRPVGDKFSWNVSSNTSYDNQPTTLRILPMHYPEIFDSPQDYPNGQQRLDLQRFKTNNNTYFNFTHNRWSFFVNGALNANVEWMNSGLSPMDGAGEIIQPVDSMSNDIYWQKLDIVVGPSVSYRIGNKFSVSAYANFDFMSLMVEDMVRNQNQSLNKMIISPSLSVNGQITHSLKYSARASYNENYGGLYDSYGGFIMTDYRSISKKDGDISHTQRENYSASLDYGNAIRSLFAGVEASYWRSENNLTYGTSYNGSLSYIESYAIPTSSNGYNLAARFSKRIDGIGTLFNVSGGYSNSNNEIIRQQELMQTTNEMITAKFGFNTRFTQALRLDYQGEYHNSVSHIDGIGKLDPIDRVTQEATVSVIIKKKLICEIGGIHYYNDAISSMDRNMFFVDASLSYKTKKIEYSLEARNLLDTGKFRSASTSDITNYIYSYDLRPASIIFKIKFSLR